MIWAAIKHKKNRETIWHQSLHRGMGHSTLGAGFWKYRRMKQKLAIAAILTIWSCKTQLSMPRILATSIEAVGAADEEGLWHVSIHAANSTGR